MNINPQLQEKYQNLQERLTGLQKVVVAYSGGVDSVLLLKVACDTLGGANVIACIGDSESLARSELENALQIAKDMQAQIATIYPQEMDDPDYQANPANRCFHCKSHLYKMLSEICQKNKFTAVLCGTNYDDLSDFRPGLQAAKVYNVLSPLEEAMLTKNDIRVLSKQLDLPTWDKPAHPCLASRIPYNMDITPEKLKQIEDGEAFLRQLGLKDMRVRHHGNLVRIEVPADMIISFTAEERRAEVIQFFKELGFNYVTVDLQGFRSGSGNEVL